MVNLILAAAIVASSYQFHLDHVLDGDTYRGAVDLWPGIEMNVDVRLNGVDAPELFHPSKSCPDHERDLAKKAKALVEMAMQDGDVSLFNVSLGKYAGRVVADVLVTKNGETTVLADALLRAGLAVRYDGGTKTKDWCNVRNP